MHAQMALTNIFVGSRPSYHQLVRIAGDDRTINRR